MRIVLADDHALMRHCLKICLSSHPDLTVIGEAADGEQALRMVADLQPDVLVADVSMPRMNGIELTKRVTESHSDACSVLALSMHSEREFVREMFRAGASGYVVKSAAYDELVLALHTIADGGTYVSPAVAAVLVDSFINPDTVASEIAGLTERERTILGMVAGGLNTKEIAFRLGLSDKTVHAFRKRLMNKLDVQSVAELTKIAIRCGLTVLQ